MNFHDRPVFRLNGFVAFFVLAGVIAWAIYGIVQSEQLGRTPLLHIVVAAVAFFCMKGLFLLKPRQGAVFLFFGRYAGVAAEEGLYWTNPFYSRTKISTQLNNFETNKLKVNEAHGSPIEIAAIIVWRVQDLAQAELAIDDYHTFLKTQSESALRNIASTTPYTSADPKEMSLARSSERVVELLQQEIQQRVNQAGILIEEARISHLAYAPEIAGAMLQVQQAKAMLAARKDIVLAATSMVDDVLQHFEQVHGREGFDPKMKAEMARSLMIILCSQREAQPVLNAV
jgi:regulator of protease activity HflC (stomatin/prohibitin superfamily)